MATRLAETTLGVVFIPALPPERLRSIATTADACGLDELWLWEDCFRESGIATAAAVLGWTERLRVSVGLLPVPLRNVALTAMEVATLARLFPGRFTPAVGHGVQDWMGQVGARAESPLTLLREYATALRRLLAGEEVSADGRYVHLDRVALDWPPDIVPAVLAGGIGPKTLRLCGEIADGTVLSGGSTPADVSWARGLVGEGMAATGRSGPHPIALYLIAATGPDAQARVRTEQERWNLEPGPDRGVGGDAATVAAAVDRWAAAGASTVVLQPTQDDPDLEGFVRFVAEEVRPLVGRAG